MRGIIWAGTVCVSVFPYNASAQVQASDFTFATRFDGAGRVTGTISPDPDGPGPLAFPATRNTYDAAGQLVKTESGILSAWKDSSVLPSQWGASFQVLASTELAYDSYNRKVQETSKGADGAINSVIRYSYDSASRLKCTAVRMDPDQWGTQPDACTGQSNGPQGPDRITRNEYDIAGQLVQVRQAVGTGLEQAYATYTYTANGKQEYIIDANGNKAQMVYDGFDRLKRWNFPSTQKPGNYAPSNQAGALGAAGSVNTSDYEEYTYDANGNRIALRKRDGSNLSYDYDNLNRVSRKVVPERTGLSSAATRDVYFAYDLQGHQTYARFESASGEGIQSEFDGLGREISHTLNLDGTIRKVSYQYDAHGNRIRVTQPDGAYARYDYDGLDRLKQAWWGWTNSDVEQSFSTVTYSPNGLRNMIVRGSSSTSYGYDNSQRLSSLAQNFNAGTGNLNETFAYNAAGQTNQETINNNAYTYKARLNVNRPYAVNGLNQYTSINGRSFCHDANGNLTADGTDVYLYDVENRLVEKRTQVNTSCSALAYSGSLKVSLRYDPMGRLYETVGNVTGTTRMVYDGDKLLTEYSAAGNLQRRYLWGDHVDEPLAWDEGGLLNCSGTRFLAGNRQGSIVATADCDGNLTRTFAYDEYGIPQAGDSGPLTPAAGARFLYTGQAFQPDLGMYYYKARMYSPTIGRFMQTDPVGYDDQINLYSYVGSDPLNKVDPFGEYTCGNGLPCPNGIKEFVEDVHKAASQQLPHSGKTQLDKIDAALGTEGQKGVDFKVDPELNTEARYEFSDGKIHINPDRIEGEGRGGEVITHEVDHRLDVKENGVFKNKAGRLKTEERAYRAQNEYNQVTGRPLVDPKAMAKESYRINCVRRSGAINSHPTCN